MFEVWCKCLAWTLNFDTIDAGSGNSVTCATQITMNMKNTDRFYRSLHIIFVLLSCLVFMLNSPCIIISFYLRTEIKMNIIYFCICVHCVAKNWNNKLVGRIGPQYVYHVLPDCFILRCHTFSMSKDVARGS